MPIVPERFREARLARGWEDQEECAKQLNTTQQTISQIENGQIKNPRNLDKYARELGVSIAWLMGETDTPTIQNSTTSVRPVPVLSYDEVESWLKRPTLTKKYRTINMQLSDKFVSKKLFAVRIVGDSMLSPHRLEESYFDGHYALVDPEKKPKVGNGVFVRINNELKLRNLAKDGTELILQALNPKYPDHKIDKHTKILGVVLYTQRVRVEELEKFNQ